MSELVWTPEFLAAHPEIRSLLVPKLTKYVAHEPHEKQTAFLLLDDKDALYGGAVGGGKSDALLMAALQYVDTPGYSALLLRRSYTELTEPGALISRSWEWLGPTDAKWRGDEFAWRFPSGAVVSFGYLDHENHKDRYQSAEYQFVGIDEVTEYPEPKWPIFLFSRLRRLRGSRVPLRFRVASNPIGRGADWVHKRYIVNGPSYVNPVTEKAEPRRFVPATLEDNPYLDRESYESMLAELDPLTRNALRFGVWGARPPGRYFRRSSIDLVARSALPKIEELTLVRWWDLAATEEDPFGNDDPDYTVGVLLGHHPASNMSYVLDVRRARVRPSGVERMLVEGAEVDTEFVRGQRGRVRIFVVQDPGAGGKIAAQHLARRVLSGYAVQVVPETGSKEDRARPVSAAADLGGLAIVEATWNEEFLDELEAFPDGPHDDQVDALSGAYAMATGRAERVTSRKAKLWD